MARRAIPEKPRLYRVEVLRSERLTPHMHRVTVGGEAFATFPWMRYDHWFRLFLRLPHQASFEMPEISGKKWWEKYFEVPEEIRPHCANYTVADMRPDDNEMDIEFVVHKGPTGEPEGPAAIWACNTAAPGEPLALFDQGLIYEAPDDVTEMTLVADESGLPAITSILRSLPEHTVGRVIQEVPTAADRRELAGPPGMDITWVDREDHGVVPGTHALKVLQSLESVDSRGYGFVVGESTLATEGRRHLNRIGLPKDRITFSGFWKH